MSNNLPHGYTANITDKNTTKNFGGGGERERAEREEVRRQYETEFENTVPSMEDLVRMREQNEAADMALQPSEVLEQLSQGNVRFWSGQASRPELNAMQRRAEIWQNYPVAAILV